MITLDSWSYARTWVWLSFDLVFTNSECQCSLRSHCHNSTPPLMDHLSEGPSQFRLRLMFWHIPDDIQQPRLFIQSRVWFHLCNFTMHCMPIVQLHDWSCCTYCSTIAWLKEFNFGLSSSSAESWNICQHSLDIVRFNFEPSIVPTQCYFS